MEDGTTVPLHYQLAPNELIADREAMEREFWSLAELEGVSDVEELNRVLDRAVTLKNMLKNPERISGIAAFVAEHFREKVEPMGYKAFLVAVDREACVLYKRELDKHLPSEYSAVVISPGQGDPPLLAQYHLSEQEEQQIRKAFRRPDEPPKILIVTEKLLTGFDAPILYCMCLDKPMRDHVLLQAIARVNRPEDGEGRRKTAEIVQRHTHHIWAVHEPKIVYRVDTDALERIAGEERPETVKVFNLIKAFYKLVQEKGREAPYLIPIGERAEQIAKAFEERQLSAREALLQLEQLVEDYKAAERDRRESDLSPEGFAVFWLLKKEGVPQAALTAQEVSAAFERFPHWQRGERQERELRKSIYKALIDSGVERVVEWTDRLLTMLRRASP
jgi:type I restriction enzyme R subunit